MNIKRPSKFKFNIIIEIYGVDKKGDMYKLILHTKQNTKSRQNVFLNYQDRIEKGDIIEDKVRKAIKEDFDIEEIQDIEFLEQPKEDLQEDDEQVFDYTVMIQVPYDIDTERKIGDVYASWFGMSNSSEE
jgi:hypothetical protein